MYISIENKKSSVLTPFLLIFKNCSVLVTVVKAQIRQIYIGSVLGWAWIFLYPLVFLALYSGVYLFVFNIRFPELSTGAYVFSVFCGLVPYIGFTDALQQGSQSLEANSNLIKSSIFPVVLVPVKVVLASQTVHLVSIGILGLTSLFMGYASIKILYLPVIFALQVLFIQGIVWVLSALMLAIKDIRLLLNLILLFMLFISPIAFMPDMVPESFKLLLAMNPLHYVISLYRASLIASIAFPLTHFCVLAAVSILSFLGGYFIFSKMEEVLADYV